jgi:hypothetical protein
MASLQELTRRGDDPLPFDERFGRWTSGGYPVGEGAERSDAREANRPFRVPRPSDRLPYDIHNILTPDQIKSRVPRRKAEGGFGEWLAEQPASFSEWLGSEEAAPQLAAMTGGGYTIGERVGKVFTAGKPRQLLDPTLQRFAIFNEERYPVASATIKIEGPDAKEAYIEGLFSDNDKSWTLGPSGVRQLIRQLKQRYPNLEKLHAYRISGARERALEERTSGGVEDPEGHTHESKMTLDISKYSGLPWTVLPGGAVLFGGDGKAEAAEPGQPAGWGIGQYIHDLAGAKALRLPQAIVNAIGQVAKEDLDSLVGALQKSYAAEARGEHDIPSLLQIAGTMGIGGPPISRVAGPTGDLGVFAGIRARPVEGMKPSTTEGRMEASSLKGVLSKKDLWEKTGWYRGSDGKWRFEIPDEGVQGVRHPEGLPPKGTVKDYIKHDVLFRAYPDLADVEVEFSSDLGGASGAHTPGEPGFPEKILLAPPSKPTTIINRNVGTVLLHELQHAIQDREGFSQGGSPKSIKSMVLSTLASKARDISRRVGSGDQAAQAEKKEMEGLLQRMKDDPTMVNQIFHKWYLGLPGETEARNVEERFRGSREGTDPYGVPPWETERPLGPEQFDWQDFLIRQLGLHPHLEVP